ncbi:Protein of unknown function [Pseudoxanthobacter soli DSM 19599]|uniref:DUF2937 family protein n=1 Tax=Pseudoxanthobacter soli DSM 19599 TaxID=1123029 RepID=A0A1M7ZDN8_9HYPH|nr:DUF2937 family protein [Pseudoxanthobacter soli]SHO62997.1 Protein of unknown function [Pseudoxanthobacter soli DSM 19599]
MASFKTVRRTGAIAVAGAVGIVFSQAPEFGQQYRQRLGGALAELKTVVADFDADAKRNDLDRKQALDQMRISSDLFIQDRAASMERTIHRYDDLSAQDQAYRTSGPFGRVAAIATHYDPALVDGTLDDFEPAVPVTIEGFVAAGAGFFLALIAMALGGRACSGVFRRVRGGRPRYG